MVRIWLGTLGWGEMGHTTGRWILLSRLPNPENHSDIELDEPITGLDAEIADPELHTVAIINLLKTGGSLKRNRQRFQTQCTERADLPRMARQYQRAAQRPTCLLALLR